MCGLRLPKLTSKTPTLTSVHIQKKIVNHGCVDVYLNVLFPGFMPLPLVNPTCYCERITNSWQSLEADPQMPKLVSPFAYKGCLKILKKLPRKGEQDFTGVENMLLHRRQLSFWKERKHKRGRVGLTDGLELFHRFI